MTGVLRRWTSVVVGCLVVLGIAVACADGPLGVDSDPAPTELLDESFRFCHDADAKDPDTLAYCPLLEHVPDDVCPGLREACANPDTDAVPPDSGCGDRGSDGSQAPVPPDVDTPAPTYSPPVAFAGEALVQLISWTVAFLVAAALVALVVVVARTLLNRSGRSKAIVEPEAPSTAVFVDVPDATAIPEAPAGDLLDAARRALDDGRNDDAVLLARGAALRALGDNGELRLHRSRTDREYVRSLRRDRERQGRLRLIVRAVEAVRWGGRPLGRDAARKAVDAASGLTAVLLLLFASLAASDAHAAEQHALRGRAALVGAYEEWGFEASLRLRTLRSVDDTVDVLVVDTNRLSLADEDVAALRTWTQRGGLLVLLGPGWDFPELGTYETATVDDVAVSREARDQGLGVPVYANGPSGVWRGATGTPLLVVSSQLGGGVGSGVVAQLVPVGAGAMVAVADGVVFDNGSLMVPENVAFVGALPWVASYLSDVGLNADATLEVADMAGAAGADNPVASLSNARLLPLVAQLLLVLVVAALWRGWPFGPLRDPPAEGRLAFAEHARALGHRFFRVGASRHVAASHADLWLRRLGPVALQAAAERHGMEPPEARALVERLQRLADEPDGPDEPVDIRIVEELWRITRTP